MEVTTLSSLFQVVNSGRCHRRSMQHLDHAFDTFRQFNMSFWELSFVKMAISISGGSLSMGFFGFVYAIGTSSFSSGDEEDAPKDDCESLLWAREKSGSSSRIWPGELGVEEEAESSTFGSGPASGKLLGCKGSIGGRVASLEAFEAARACPLCSVLL